MKILSAALCSYLFALSCIFTLSTTNSALAIRLYDGCSSIDIMNHVPHLKFLPILNRTTSSHPVPIPEGYNFCNLRETCCESYQLLNTKAAYVHASFYLDAIKNRVLAMFADRDDVYILALAHVQQTLKNEGKSVGQDLRKAVKDLAYLEDSYNSRFLAQNVFDVINDIIGYFSALSCSICDPNSENYVSSSTVKGKYVVNLTMTDRFLNDFSADVENLLSAIEKFFNEKAFKKAFVNVMFETCKAANGPHNCVYDQIMKKYDNFIDLMMSKGKLVTMVCGKDVKCKSFIGGTLFRALGIYLNPMRDNIMSFLSKNCQKDDDDCHGFIHMLSMHDFDMMLNTNGTVPSMSIINSYVSKEDVKKLKDKSFALDIEQMASQSQMVKQAFEREDFLVEKHGAKRSGLNFVRILLLLFVLGVVGYGLYVAYNKRVRAQADGTSSYSALA